MSDDILQIAMTSYYDRTKYAAIPEGMKAAINAVLPIQENYFIEKYYNVIFSDDNNIVNELRNYLEDRDIQINRIDEDNKRLLKENEKLREALRPIVPSKVLDEEESTLVSNRLLNDALDAYLARSRHDDDETPRAAYEGVKEP